MINYRYILTTILAVFLFSACSDEIEYVDSKEPASISVADIEENTINIYTGKTFQVEINVRPAEAEITDPIEYIYKSSDNTVFEVNEKTGLIIAKAEGVAVLDVKSINYEHLTTKAIVKVKDEFFQVSEINVDAAFKEITLIASGDNSVTGAGISLLLKDKFTVLPENASNKDVEFITSDPEVATISEDGNIVGLKAGETTITIKSKDGSNKVSEPIKVTVKDLKNLTPISRVGWTIKGSHNAPIDGEKGSYEGPHEFMLDGKTNTYASFVKAGKSYGNPIKVSVPSGAPVFFVIDTKAQHEFNYIAIRNAKTESFLTPNTYTLFGKNEENEEYKPIYETMNAVTVVREFKMLLPDIEKYRFVKFVITPDLNNTGGSTMQISELELGVFKH